MREFSSTDLGNKTGDVLAAASQEPVTIVRHDKARFVVLATETFERSQTSADPRIARRTSDIPARDGEGLAAVLERIINSDD